MQLFYEHRQLPGGDSARRKVVLLMWACMVAACVQFILAAAMMSMWKQLWELYKLDVKQNEEALKWLEMQISRPPPPPPQPVSPATDIDAGVNTPLLPPGGSTFSAAPQPVGDTPSAVPGCGTGHRGDTPLTAPLLGGYVRSMAELLGGGYTALPGQPADAPVPPLQQ